MFFLGARRSCAAKLGKQHVSRTRDADGLLWMRWRVEKNRGRKPVDVARAIPPDPEASLAAAPTGELAFLVSERGTPFTVESFGNAFRKRCRDAGLPHCGALGLRKSQAVDLAYRGASERQMNALMGRVGGNEAARYTRQAERETLAAAEAMLPGKSHREKWDKTASQDVDSIGSGKRLVPRGGIEPPTLRFSVACSTN